MNFTFGIITGGGADNRILKIINSIKEQKIQNYEIIIVGNSEINGDFIKNIPFDETIKPKWITKKKNIITKNSNYENIVFLHDYIKLDKNWYNGFLKFGNNFSICMTKMKTPSGKRYRDWTIDAMANISHITNKRYNRLLPYRDLGLTNIMYISGAYWVAKKEIMEKYPLDERLSWGESEDIEWSHRVRKNIQFFINPDSIVWLLTEKNPSFLEMDKDLVNKFINLTDNELQIIIDHGDKYYKENHE